MVGSWLDAVKVHTSGGAISEKSPSFCSLTPLEVFFSSSSSFKESLVWLICHHFHVVSLQCLCFWLVSTSSLFTSYTKGLQAVISPATLAVFAECYDQWFLLCCFESPHCQDESLQHSLLARIYNAAKTPHFPLLVMARVFVSDKLVKFILIQKIKAHNVMARDSLFLCYTVFNSVSNIIIRNYDCLVY